MNITNGLAIAIFPRYPLIDWVNSVASYEDESLCPSEKEHTYELCKKWFMIIFGVVKFKICKRSKKLLEKMIKVVYSNAK